MSDFRAKLNPEQDHSYQAEEKGFKLIVKNILIDTR
jgi:hypothetical protein